MWTTLLIGAAAIGISVDEADADRGKVERLTQLLAESLEAHTGRRAVLDTGLWSDCDRSDRCVHEIRARTGATDVLYVRIFGGVSRVLLAVERVSPDGKVTEDNLSVTRERDRADVEALVRRLFPVAPAPPLKVEVPPPPPKPRQPRLWPALSLGTLAVVSTGLAIGFGISARDAAGQLRSRITVEEAFVRLDDRRRSHGTMMITFSVVAAVAAAGALTAWLVELWLTPEGDRLEVDGVDQPLAGP